MSFTVIVNLWRIFKAVETLGGYDSVSNNHSYDYVKRLKKKKTLHASVRKMHSGSSTATAWFQPHHGCLGCKDGWVSLVFDVVAVGRTATQATHSERTQEATQKLQAQFERTTITPLCVRIKNDDSSYAQRSPTSTFRPSTLQLCQLGGCLLALWQWSRTHSEGVACVKMWVVTFHHTSFYRFPQSAAKKWLSYGSPVCRQCAPGNIPNSQQGALSLVSKIIMTV